MKNRNHTGIIRRIVTGLLAAAVVLTPMNALAAPELMPDGGLFDAEYYASQNPDVVAALGSDASVLYNHYLVAGRSEGRRPCDPMYGTNPAVIAAQYIAVKQYYNRSVFIGDSITDRYRLDDHYSELSLATYNRGIAGDKTGGVLSRLEVSLFALEPTKVSLLIGINDVTHGVSDQTLLANYEEILDQIQARLPEAEVCCISILPVNADCADYKIDYEDVTERIPALNATIQALAEAHGYRFVNLYPLFADEEGYLIAEYSTDGLHLSAAGYEIWTNVLKPKLA